MLDLSAINPQSALGRVLRLPLRIVPRSAEMPILQGPLRGKRWVAGSSIHRCWLGFYEGRKQKRIASILRPGMVCYDLGANVGFYTLLFSSLTGPTGSVIAFEPLPQNCERLRYHLEMNRCKNARLQPIAISNFDGLAHFSPAGSNAEGRLSRTGALEVQCRRLDTVVAEEGLPSPNIMKIDVEGEENRVLEGARDTIRTSRPTIFVATHGPQPHDACCLWLRDMRYDVQPLGAPSVVETDELVAIPL